MRCGRARRLPRGLWWSKPPAGQRFPSSTIARPLRFEVPPTEQADRLRAAVHKMDEGSLGEATRLLTALHEELPDNGLVLHELALCYRLRKQPEKAIELLEPYVAQLPADTLAAYGSALDEAGRTAEAEKALRAGIQKHRDGGILYSELGTLLSNAGRTDEALEIYQQGISADPRTAPNYLHAATLLASAHHGGAALIYGEVFRLLEPATDRSREMAVMMAKILQDNVKVTTEDGKPAVRLTLAPPPVVDAKEASAAELPMENVFEMLFGAGLSLANPPIHSLEQVHQARSTYLAALREGKGTPALREYPLTRWQLALDAAGLLETYDYWLYSPAYEEDVKEWASRPGAKQKLEKLIDYLSTHPLFPETR